MRLGAVVVLFHPEDVLANILTYADSVEWLVLVDNSPSPMDSVALERLGPLVLFEYVHRPENVGVAAALNLGAASVVKHGCTHLLTMDQDSRFPEGEFVRFRQASETVIVARIGMTAPLHSGEVGRRVRSGVPRRIDMTMTSGCILSMDAYRDCGAFDENLFIDHVDHEYCLRMNARRWEVLEIPGIVLEHRLGAMKQVEWLRFAWMEIVSHAPIRDYYVVRNGLFVMRKYRRCGGVGHVRRCVRDVVVKALFLETERRRRLKWILRAVSDYRCGRMGRVSD